jgi:hypothetical protein
MYGLQLCVGWASVLVCVVHLLQHCIACTCNGVCLGYPSLRLQGGSGCSTAVQVLGSSQACMT